MSKSNVLDFSSGLADDIKAMVDFRKSMGVTDYEYLLSKFDRFCVSNYPDRKTLEREMVLNWIADERSQHNRIRNNAVAIRQLGKYIVSEGKHAYVLPNDFVSSRTNFVPYIFTDEDLTRFFQTTDSLKYRSATVTLSGKGRKVRCVTLMDSTMKHLHNYIRLTAFDGIIKVLLSVTEDRATLRSDLSAVDGV